MEKYQYCDGLKFTRDDKTGYYLNSTIHKRLHVYVWEKFNGKVPIGYEVHHIDLNKSNNDISNLQLLSSKKHKKLHGTLLTKEQREWRRNNLNFNARPKAIEWHKSEEAKGFHSKIGKLGNQVRFTPKLCTCVYCGETFMGNSKYCSGKCKAAYRRKYLGDSDKEIRVCEICGKEFSTNKYKSAITCSIGCRNKLNWRHRNENKENN